jgi:hypothetical protein
MKNAFKAIEAIEKLVGGDFGMDMEFYLYDRPKLDKTQLKKRLRQAARLITDIYVIAHAESTCTGHPSWQKKKYEVLASH